MTCEILVPQPGIKPVSPAVEAQSPNHCTSEEVSQMQKKNKFLEKYRLNKDKNIHN